MLAHITLTLIFGKNNGNFRPLNPLNVNNKKTAEDIPTKFATIIDLVTAQLPTKIQVNILINKKINELIKNWP